MITQGFLPPCSQLVLMFPFRPPLAMEVRKDGSEDCESVPFVAILPIPFLLLLL